MSDEEWPVDGQKNETVSQGTGRNAADQAQVCPTDLPILNPHLSDPPQVQVQPMIVDHISDWLPQPKMYESPLNWKVCKLTMRTLPAGEDGGRRLLQCCFQRLPKVCVCMCVFGVCVCLGCVCVCVLKLVVSRTGSMGPHRRVPSGRGLCQLRACGFQGTQVRFLSYAPLQL